MGYAEYNKCDARPRPQPHSLLIIYILSFPCDAETAYCFCMSYTTCMSCLPMASASSVVAASE